MTARERLAQAKGVRISIRPPRYPIRSPLKNRCESCWTSGKQRKMRSKALARARRVSCRFVKDQGPYSISNQKSIRRKTRPFQGEGPSRKGRIQLEMMICHRSWLHESSTSRQIHACGRAKQSFLSTRRSNGKERDVSSRTS